MINRPLFFDLVVTSWHKYCFMIRSLVQSQVKDKVAVREFVSDFSSYFLSYFQIIRC